MQEFFSGSSRWRKMITRSDDERFQDGAQDYAAYLETPEGRLRTDLAFANLQEFLPTPQAKKPMYALDVGCGTGATAVRLARLGFHITELDSSQAMLDIARRTAEEAAVTNSVILLHGDGIQLTNLFGAASFDVVLCHNRNATKATGRVSKPMRSRTPREISVVACMGPAIAAWLA